jgi:lipopolysaccharide transport system ATP-binding protein
MKEVSRQGRTVLFVSHNMVTIRQLCRRVLYIRAGRLCEDGEITTITRYVEEASGAENENL